MRQNPWNKRRALFASTVPKVVEEPKVKWKILPILWVALRRTCTFLGAVILMFSIMALWTLGPVMDELDVSLPDEMVLYMDLDGELGDMPKGAGLIDSFSQDNMTVKNFIDALYRAKSDARVKGIYARLKSPRYSIANVQEIRTALDDFKKSGKFAYIFSSSLSGGTGTYYLATAFDEIWMQPMGALSIPGLNAELPFFRNVLDKVGVEPQFLKRKEFKSAYESFTNSEISKANELSTRTLVDDLVSVFVKDISASRNISTAEFKKQMDKGLLVRNEALDAGLVDFIDYEDQLVEKVNERVNGDPDKDAVYVAFESYIDEMVTGRENADKDESKPNIALVYAVGAIVEGSDYSDGYVAADYVAAALLEAADDENIAAVVLRVNSPGGSPVASETILRALGKIKEQGKPVIISMGSVAASGGYWISAYADQIFVLPTTITGSIGVLGGKVSLKELWSKIGVNWARISAGENSGMWSANTPFSTGERERMDVMLDSIYDGFIERVAKGRNMSPEAADNVARGRPWSGVRAVEIGLADQFGGLNSALDYAAQKIDVKNRYDADIVILPRPLSKVEQFVALLEGQVHAGEIIGMQASFVEYIRPVLSQLMVIQSSAGGSVYAPISVQ